MQTLQWPDVDFSEREIRLDDENSKNGEPRIFPFTSDLQTLLNARQVERERLQKGGKIVPWVFCRRDGQQIRTFRGSWLTARREAGVPGRLLHDLPTHSGVQS